MTDDAIEGLRLTTAWIRHRLSDPTLQPHEVAYPIDPWSLP